MIKLITPWRILTPLTQNICMFTLANTVLVNLIIVVIFSTSWDELVTDNIKFFFLFQQKSADSWQAMINALNYLQSEHKKSLYEQIFFENKIKFQYPPTSLIILYPIKFLSLATGKSMLIVLKDFSWIFIIIMNYFIIRIFNFSLKKNIYPSKKYFSPVDLVIRNTFLVCLTLAFYPVIKAYSLGQIQAWINSLFTICFWFWMNEKKGISGAIAGTMCLIKPQYSIILLWGILRKQWNFSIAFAATTLTGILASLLLFGIADNISYLSVLSFISKHGEAFYANQSINGLLNRLLFNGDNLFFDPHSFSPFNPWVYFGTTISSIALISMALLQPKDANEKGNTTDFAIVALTSTIASPVAWEHHYGILLPIYAFLLPCLLENKIFGRLTLLYFCISYLLSSNYFAITKELAYADFNLNIIQSYLLFGGLMTLICLYVLRAAKINKIASRDSASKLLS